MPRWMKTPAVLFVFLAAVSTSHAYMEHADITKRWGVGFNLSGSVPSSNSADPGMSPVVNFNYGIIDHIALQVELGYTEMNYEALGIDFGDVQGVPLVFSVQWRYPFLFSSTPATAYAVTGFGTIFWEFDNTGDSRAAVTEVEDAFVFKLGGGVDFFVTDNWVANVEGSYYFSDTTVSLVDAGGSKVEAETDFWRIGGGAKYFF